MSTVGRPERHRFPNTDDLVGHNHDHAARLDGNVRSNRPSRELAIVACMDSRMDIFEILGLENGEAHIIRNAGGAITDDVIRSLVLSQRFLGTREILLMHHTDCGLHNLDENKFNAEIEAELGVRPSWALESFTDPAADVRQSMRRLHLSPFVKHKDFIRGFVYDVATGQLHEVE